MPFAPSPTDGSIPTDLVLLAAERAVTVTREEHHQDVLSGRTGRAVVELRPCPIASGKHAGQDGLEVVLDGRRVGELTRLMAQRYRPMVDHLTARGYRAGCEAFLQEDARGTQVELRLPAGRRPPGFRAPRIRPSRRQSGPGARIRSGRVRRPSLRMSCRGSARRLRRPQSRTRPPPTTSRPHPRGAISPRALGRGRGDRGAAARLRPRQRRPGRPTGRRLATTDRSLRHRPPTPLPSPRRR